MTPSCTKEQTQTNLHFPSQSVSLCLQQTVAKQALPLFLARDHPAKRRPDADIGACCRLDLQAAHHCLYHAAARAVARVLSALRRREDRPHPRPRLHVARRQSQVADVAVEEQLPRDEVVLGHVVKGRVEVLRVLRRGLLVVLVAVLRPRGAPLQRPGPHDGPRGAAPLGRRPDACLVILVGLRVPAVSHLSIGGPARGRDEGPPPLPVQVATHDGDATQLGGSRRVQQVRGTA